MKAFTSSAIFALAATLSAPLHAYAPDIHIKDVVPLDDTWVMFVMDEQGTHSYPEQLTRRQCIERLPTPEDKPELIAAYCMSIKTGETAFID